MSARANYVLRTRRPDGAASNLFGRSDADGKSALEVASIEASAAAPMAKPPVPRPTSAATRPSPRPPSATAPPPAVASVPLTAAESAWWMGGEPLHPEELELLQEMERREEEEMQHALHASLASLAEYEQRHE